MTSGRPRLRARAILLSGLLLPLVAGAARSSSGTASAELVLTGTLEQGGFVRGIAPPGTVRLTLDGRAVLLDPNRQFILGFDRDQSPYVLLVAERGAAAPVKRDLTIAPHAWQIEKVDVARLPEAASAEYLRRRAGETHRIEAARTVVTGASGWRQRFIWPASGRISGVFGSQRIYRGELAAFHSGVDLAAGAGARVVAPADGVVVLAGPPVFSLEGNLVIIDHGMGLNSAFLHLATEDVRVGDVVHQGQTIGTVGSTGRATGPHLHWSVKWQHARIDPARLVEP